MRSGTRVSIPSMPQRADISLMLQGCPRMTMTGRAWQQRCTALCCRCCPHLPCPGLAAYETGPWQSPQR